MTALQDRVEEVFAALLEYPPEAQATMLAEFCGNDSELQVEVESLLAAAANSKGFLSLAPIRLPFTDILDPQTQSGRRLGPYRLIREIGRGGMGSVFLAERADGQYRQQVAIKLAHYGLGKESPADRFHIERQILA